MLDSGSGAASGPFFNKDSESPVEEKEGRKTERQKRHGGSEAPGTRPEGLIVSRRSRAGYLPPPARRGVPGLASPRARVGPPNHCPRREVGRLRPRTIGFDAMATVTPARPKLNPSTRPPKKTRPYPPCFEMNSPDPPALSRLAALAGKAGVGKTRMTVTVVVFAFPARSEAEKAREG